MEADSQSRPAPPEFIPRQMELIGALPKVGNRFPLGSMFKGALIAMKQENNPEAFVHAALSLRELIVNFERTINLPLSGYDTEKDPGFVKVNVGQYAGRWSDTKSVSACFVRDSSSWTGTIDPVLLGFLTDTETFIRQYNANEIYLKNKETAVMVTLDPMFENLSEDEQRRIAQEWVWLRKFFNEVTHHGSVTRLKMENALERLEIFLHRRLIPVEVENKNAILKFIEGIESP